MILLGNNLDLMQGAFPSLFKLAVLIKRLIRNMVGAIHCHSSNNLISR